jgi:replicative DNA helicase
LASNIAVRVRRGGTLFFSVEMDRREMIRRLIADLGKVDWASIARRRPPQPDDYESARIARGAARLLGFSIDVLHRRELTPSMVRRQARLALQQFDGKLDLIIIDYLQLMDADPDEKRRRDRRDLEIGSITKALKSIASEFDCPVLLLSQVNRDAVKTPSGEPELWNLRDSGAIEQDADVVVFIWESRGKADANENEIEIEWKIAKQRNGPKTRLLPLLRFERDITRFR